MIFFYRSCSIPFSNDAATSFTDLVYADDTFLQLSLTRYAAASLMNGMELE